MSRRHESVLAVSGLARVTSDEGGEVSTTYGSLGAHRSGNARFALLVASGGGGLLTVTLQGSIDGVLVPLGSFSSVAGPDVDTIMIPECPDLVKAVWTITSGTFTFGVTCSRF